MGNNSYKSKYSGEQIEAMFDIVMSNTKEDKANKVTKITDGLSAEKYPSAVAVKSYVDAEINNIDDTLEQVEAVAKGRAVGYVFDTVDDMNEWLQNPDNVALLNLGDNFYIRDKNVPDYWWDKDTGTAQELETQKVDLAEYVKSEEGKGLSTNDLTDIKDAVLKDILAGGFVLEGGNGQKLYIYYDNIYTYGGTLNIDLSGGELQRCTTADIEVLRYLDLNTNKLVDLHGAIDSKATKEEVAGLNTSIRKALGERETLSFLDIHNTETRGSYPIDELTIDIPDGEYPEQFIAGLVFSSGETAPTVIYPANNRILQWVGTDCSSTDEYSVFIPTSNKNYDIVFYFNGTHFVGLVNGYETVTSNTEV